MDFALRTCLLRPFRYEDLASLVRHANDAEVSRAVRDHFPYPYAEEDAERWLAHATTAGKPTNLAIEVEGEAVGGIGCVPGDDVNRITAELGYWLGRAHWGRGIMSEAVTAYTAHLLGERAFLRVEAEVYSSNPASARVLEKAGFVREGVMRRAVIKRGEILDVWMYGRLAGE